MPALLIQDLDLAELRGDRLFESQHLGFILTSV